MNKKPTISVVMPVYKENAQVLKRAIDSIMNQTFQDYEFIIILDNPYNIEAINLIEDFKNNDERIILILNDKNLGVAPTLNIGVKAAKGEYIARQDADDESLPYRFEKQINYLNTNPNIDVIGTSLDYVDENEKLIFKRNYNSNPEKYIRKYNPVGHPTLLIKRELFEKFGFYSEDEKFKYVEDYELWIRWYLKGVKFYNLDDTLYKYYQNKSNIKNRNTKLQLRNTIKLKREYRNSLVLCFGDNLRLIGEMLLNLLPSGLITYLFYKFYNK
ncbi:MAG: glycosyltransferase [Ignavibacteriae bacterium]|nr:glycosyltransferase [Ignavibacteriota bacterium]